MSSFYDLVLMLGLVACGGLVAERLKVPLLSVYLAAGIVLGPAVLGLVAPSEGLTSLGSLGVSLFLFSVALKLDLRTFRSLGWRALWAGVGQIGACGLLAWLVAAAVGLRGAELALAVPILAVSSTIVVVKILTEKKELDSLHGQLAIAILILQDLAIVLLLAAAASILPGRSLGNRLGLAIVGAVVLGVGYFMVAEAALRLLRYTRRNVELQLVTVLAVAALCAGVSSLLGFSRESGAFLAGLAVATSPYKESVASRLAPVRDFLLLFFFLDLGARIPLSGVGQTLLLAAALSAFVVLVKPAVVWLVLRGLRYPLRTSFLTGLALGQISEFSFLLAGTAVQGGAVGERFLSLVASVGLVTFFVSPLIMEKGEALYSWCSPLLRRLSRSGHGEESPVVAPPAVHRPWKVICFGLGRYGGRLAYHLNERGRPVLGVDFDPVALREAQAGGIDVLYGDVEDDELYARLPLETANWAVCTIRTPEAARAVVRGLHSRGWQGHLALAAEDEEQAEEFERLGAHVVLRPYEDGAELAAEAVTDAADLRLTLADWPIAFREFRIRSDAAYAGHTIAELALRNRTGATIMALSRGGRVIFDPEPSTQLFPNDRLLLMGRGEELDRAESVLEMRASEEESPSAHFEIAQLYLRPEAPVVGQTLAQSQFRRRYGVTIVGIEREGQKIIAPAPGERLQAGDLLVVIGPADRIHGVQQLPEFGLTADAAPQSKGAAGGPEATDQSRY
jgi:Kef-type K+ transport system membrane component KefB/Trk K+ transport system NAD-binding subunit